MQSWGPGILSFEAVNVNFGYFVQHIGPMKKHYWFFLIPPSGPASGSWRCWKMLSWGPGIQSFEAVIMNLGYLGQHTSSKKKTLWVLFNSTFRASFRPKKVLEIAVLRPWHPELWSGKHESRIFCSTYWLYEKHYWYFLIPTSGQASASWRCWKMQSWGPGIQSFEAVNMNLGNSVNILALWKTLLVLFIPPSGPASGSWRCWRM